MAGALKNLIGAGGVTMILMLCDMFMYVSLLLFLNYSTTFSNFSTAVLAIKREDCIRFISKNLSLNSLGLAVED